MTINDMTSPMRPGLSWSHGCRVAHDNRRFINAVCWIFENGGAMAGFAAFVWGLEEHAPKILPMACQWNGGGLAGAIDH